MIRRVICGVVLALALPVFALSTAVVAPGPGFYMFAMNAADSVASSGMSESDARLLVTDSVDYLHGKDISFDRIITIDGEPRVELTEREVTHMSDVRNIFGGIRIIALVSIGVCVLALALNSFMSKRSQSLKGRASFGKGVLIGSGVWLVVVAPLIVIGYVNFSSAFITMHEMLFTNDLWILDPRTDMLIRLMPTGFFVIFAIMIVSAWIASLAVLIIKGVYDLYRFGGAKS